MESHDRYAHQILTEIEAGDRHSQRTLASSAGIALGLTNLLMRRFVRRGWVRVVRIRPNRVRYLLTPAGIAEKSRMSRLFLQDSVRFYADVRARVGARLAELSAGWPGQDPVKRIAFYGSGEVAEITYVCLQETDLRLVAVIGETSGRKFFGQTVLASSEICAGRIELPSFGKIIVTTFDQQEAVRSRLVALGISPGAMVWLQ